MSPKLRKKRTKYIPEDQKKLLATQYVVADKQGCGYYRCIFPSDAMNHFVKTTRFSCHSVWTSKFTFDPNFYHDISYMVFQRPSTEPQLKMLQWLNQIKKQFGFRVIYEVDDDVLNIPKYNPAHEFYAPLQDTIKKTLGECDCLTTTTQVLADLYAPYIKKTQVIKNALPKWLWGEVEPRINQDSFGNEKKRFTIIWMGSALHYGNEKLGGDLTVELFEFIKKTRQKYRWIFAGALPGALHKYRKDMVVYPWKNMLEYPGFIKGVARKYEVDVGLAFILDNEFNSGKSDIKRLEYTALGVPGLYTRSVPYKECSLTYGNVDELEGRLERLRTDPDYYKKIWRKEYEAVKNRLWLEDYINVTFKFLVNNMNAEQEELKKKLQDNMQAERAQRDLAIGDAVKKAIGNNPMAPHHNDFLGPLIKG